MSSRRSRSPSSTPSEGEIIESGSETKATTSQTSVRGSHVDRRTRHRSSSYSPRRSPPPRRQQPPNNRSRSRSRSPYYHSSRGEKRRYRDDDYDDRRSSRRTYEPRYYSRDDDHPARDRDRSGRYRGYVDYDRDNEYYGDLRYTDSYSYDRREKRRRTRSRSPQYREVRKPKRYDELDSGESSRQRDTVSAEPSSVSARGVTPVVAQEVKSETEREHQVQGPRTQDARSEQEKSELAPEATAETAEPAEPMDEQAALEERRKRREAIMAKYRAQTQVPLRVQALEKPEVDSPGSGRGESPATPVDSVAEPVSASAFTVSKDDELANTTTVTDGFEKDAPSAADYDPTQDMREDRERQDKRTNGEVSAADYDETKPEGRDVPVPEAQQPAPTKDPYDMFAEDDDDMFAPDEAEPAQGATAAKPAPQAKELDMSMMDNWDDPEGYYIVRLGELINGRYHVQQNLGKGMFSSVVRATDSKTGKLVAVKIVRQNDTMRKAGMKEIEILQQLRAADPEDKKHVVRFERFFDHKGHLCMVFENLSMNLREVLKKFGRDVGLNLRAIKAYAQQMFLGLSLLRKCGILHGDLKPDNLLVNEQRNILKICDLGSASPASESEVTPYLVSRFYRAPEIILGIPYDYAIDMWSIGCTLYELYTGKILFTGRNNNGMLKSIMECRGKLPPKLLRRGSLTPMHFDEMLNFQSTEEDKVTGRVVTKVLDFKKPTRDLKTRLMGKGSKGMSESESKELALFVDLLDRCLALNPEKRCTPIEALKHPFFGKR